MVARRLRASQRKTDLDWNGQTSCCPVGVEGLVPQRDMNLWMCAEDVGTEIWAHFHRLDRRFGDDNAESLRLEECSEGLRDVLIDSLPYNQYERCLSGAVMNFAKIVAQECVMGGHVLFEVQGGWDRSGEAPRLEEARVVFVNSDSIVKLGRYLFQTVESDASIEGKDRVVRLDPRRIVTFKPPRCYRGTLARMRSRFPLIGQSESQWRRSVGTQGLQEESSTVSRYYNVQRARLSAPVGWNGRGLYCDYIADFHWACRQLQWHRFCIEVRDGILTTLNRVFTMIGAWRGESPHLVWQHLPTIEQVDAGESLLMNKGARFDEVLKPFKLQAEPTST